MAQSIVEYVDTTLDNAAIGRIHSLVFAIVTAGLFFDVIDFIILGSLVPDMVRTHFASPAEIGTVGTAQIIGLFIGAVGQGEFTDRLGRKRIYQLSVLLYSLATIAAALAPNPLWLAFGRPGCRDRARCSLPNLLFVCRGICTQANSRTSDRLHAVHWRRVRLAPRHPLRVGLQGYYRLARDLGGHRPLRACRLSGELCVA